MELKSNNFSELGKIDPANAFCKLGDPVELSSNKNPHLQWTGAPAETKSFVLIVHDRDVPSDGKDVNQEGRVVPEDLPRVDFTHWLLVDIPSDRTEIAEGEFSREVTPRGKSGPAIEGTTMRQGLNDYTQWFAGDKEMEGDYFGYDGPCPPWNDTIVHHYVFTLYALDVPKVDVQEKFTREELLQALEGHVLDQASLTGTYVLNRMIALP